MSQQDEVIDLHLLRVFHTLLIERSGKRLTTTVIDDGENRHQSGAHHFRFDGHHCDRAGSQAG